MTRSPLLALVLGSQASLATFLPDTGLSVRALGYPSFGSKCLQVRLQNASRTPKSDLELRFFLTGDSADVADFALRSDFAAKIQGNGYQVTTGQAALDTALHVARARPATPGCVKNCHMIFSVKLDGLTLGAFESFRWNLVQDRRLASGELDSTAPTHPLTAADWSFSGIPLDSAKEDPYMEMGSGPIARRFQILSKGVVVWGTAPGEPEMAFPSPWKRQGLPTTIDAIRSPFADSTPQRVRDSANQSLSRILVNQAGYRESDVFAGRAWIKAIGPAATTFSVIDTDGKTVGQGTLISKNRQVSGQIVSIGSNWAGSMYGGDISHLLRSAVRSGDLLEGRIPSNLGAGGPYRIAIGGDTSATFRVDDRIYGWLRDAELRFFGVQRSGNSESWMHGPSHVEDMAPGGWYDCGDHLKQAPTQSYALAVLGSLAISYPERDADRTGYNHDSTRITDGVPDVLRELKHGSEFIIGSWKTANRNVAGTINTVGNYTVDWNGWFPSDWSDALPSSIGGQPSRTGNVDSGASVQAGFAAGLAFFSHAWKSRDAQVSADALELARSLYLAAKRKPSRPSNSYTYTSSINAYGALALAATALLVATRDTAYLRDLAYDTVLGRPTYPDSTSFTGGWLSKITTSSSALHYANPTALAMFQLHRLVLRDSAMAAIHGVRTERERALLQMRAGLAMSALAGNVGGGSTQDRSIPIPGYGFTSTAIRFDSLWHNMPVPYGVSSWLNHYQAGGIATVLLYAEMAADLQGRNLPILGATTDWKAPNALEVGVRGLDGLLGVNPWDLSLVYGVGAKNPNHPHHRTSNPDGRTLAFPYTYQTPIGALHPGQLPSTSLLTDSYSQRAQESEICLEGSATLLVPAVILAADEGPTSTVRNPKHRTAPTPVFIAKTTQRGVTLRWTGATGRVEASLFDAKGRELARSTSILATGSTEFVTTRVRGPLFARLRDDATSQTKILPGL